MVVHPGSSAGLAAYLYYLTGPVDVGSNMSSSGLKIDRPDLASRLLVPTTTGTSTFQCDHNVFFYGNPPPRGLSCADNEVILSSREESRCTQTHTSRHLVLVGILWFHRIYALDVEGFTVQPPLVFHPTSASRDDPAVARGRTTGKHNQKNNGTQDGKGYSVANNTGFLWRIGGRPGRSVVSAAFSADGCREPATNSSSFCGSHGGYPSLSIGLDA